MGNNHTDIDTGRLEGALSAWKEVIGSDRVITCTKRLEAVNRATFQANQRSVAILEPDCREQIAACLKIAGCHRVPIHPVSVGLNWGYGSMLPAHDGCVLMSLARLNRILDYNEELAYVTVEPGVSFRQLDGFLKERGSSLLPPVTGTSPDASLVATVHERGKGKGPYVDMAARGSDFEVVLPTGEIINTGFSCLPGALAANTWSYNLGPSLQGLFNQSNLGIITRMTLWLEPAPKFKQLVVFMIDDYKELPQVINVLRKPLQRQGNWLQVEILNDFRFLTQTARFPYDEFNGSLPLTPLWAKAKVGARFVGGAFLWADSVEELEIKRRSILPEIKDLVTELHIEPPVQGIGTTLSFDGVTSTYWRKRQATPEIPNPDLDGCGIIWLTPVFPMLGELTAEVLKQVEDITLSYGFEPSLILRMVGGRSFHAIIGIFYDRDQHSADQRAMECHNVLRDILFKKGLYPYRLGIYDMDSIPDVNDGSALLLQNIKRIVDPSGILSPGRYIP